MATRAAFWLGDPSNLAQREWLGCVAYDGYPNGAVTADLEAVTAPEQLRAWVAEHLALCSDFAAPSRGWPFPWDDDIYLTDFTYAFFDGQLQVACFYSGFLLYREVAAKLKEGDWEWPDTETLPRNVPAPRPYDPTQPDSIMLISSA